jgi:sarcosine oxidase/L-pipecolate oxidase
LLPSKATGPDGIPAYLLKRCSEVIAPSLAALFELSLQQGVFPSEWKAANVVPIPQKGDTHEVTNYRPVSLLSQVSTVLERLIFSQVFSFVENSL